MLPSAGPRPSADPGVSLAPLQEKAEGGRVEVDRDQVQDLVTGKPPVVRITQCVKFFCGKGMEVHFVTRSSCKATFEHHET